MADHLITSDAAGQPVIAGTHVTVKKVLEELAAWGEVDRLLSELSYFYGREVDKTMKNFTTIIEPVLILTLGLAVAGVAVAVIMPMYTLVQNF